MCTLAQNIVRDLIWSITSENKRSKEIMSQIKKLNKQIDALNKNLRNNENISDLNMMLKKLTVNENRNRSKGKINRKMESKKSLHRN